MYLSIWECPRRAPVRPRGSADSHLGRSQKTDSCPKCLLAGWTPVWDHSGLRPHTAAGRPARASARGKKRVKTGFFTLGFHDCQTHCCAVLLHQSIRRTFSQQMSVPHEPHLQKKPGSETLIAKLTKLMWKGLFAASANCQK